MKLICAIIAILLLQSCSRPSNTTDKDNIRAFEVEDPLVLLVTKTAQDSLPYFIDYFERYHGKENYTFSLKTSFNDKKLVEHMWSTPLKVNDSSFLCVLDNVPDELTNYSLGDTIEIEFVNIEDFIIVTADTLIFGNYLQYELELAQKRQ